MASLLLAVIYLAFISLGLPDSLLGAGWPVMHGFLGVPLSYAGFVSMIISVGTVISSLLSERVTKKLGTKYVTLVSVLLTALALFGFSLSTRFWMLCLYELAPLLLGRGYHREPLRHEPGPHPGLLAGGLPDGGPDPAGHLRRAAPDPAPVEGPRPRERSPTEREGPGPAGRPAATARWRAPACCGRPPT